MSIETNDLTLDAAGTPAAAYLAAPAEGGPGVLVLHAWWGLNDDFKRWCDDLAAAGFTALAPDLRAGRVVYTPTEAEALMKEFGADRTRPVVAAAADELLARTGAESFGVVGASMGANWAFDLAESDPGRVGAVVAYYGLAEADWSTVTARVLHHFGDRDHMDPVAEAEAMQQAMVEGGVDATLEVYPAADHGFAEPGRPELHRDHADLAWRRTVDFLRAP